MAEYKQMGIRLTEGQRTELEAVAETTGVEVAQLIRFAIDALLKHYHRCGRRLVLPIDFTEVINILEDEEMSRVAEGPPKMKYPKRRA